MATEHDDGGGGGRGPSLGRLFVDDLRAARLGRDHWQELKDLYHFYLDEDDRARLAGMGRLRRAFMLLGWLFKSLLRKLSPGRRLMLLIAMVFTVMGDTSFVVVGWGFRADFRPWAVLFVTIVLMLELKDKLVARDEIQIAREVQLALLPRENPSLPGWSVWCYSRPANDVGGDLVDYIELDGFRHGVLLGDVAGKGLGAALLSAKLQATLRALVPEAASLDDLGRRTNAIFNRDGIANRFATLFYAELEYNSGQLRYLNAGHNPAYVVRPGGVLKLTASSWPIGMLPEASYEECSIDLAPGDLLLAYSDGLTEARNASGEEFGAPRVERLLGEMRDLSPEQVGGRILREVDRFLGEARPSDDLSLVVLV
ncbi:MAG TPA: PP2C family protein-serine/threonine phosphatase, partial [Candidatus Polarisedimenticolaceae bacterium]|nr:PP2C family protein-serine/threonine phosphatase [Candidatus Polarisedimenticolaceae bacterium]